MRLFLKNGKAVLQNGRAVLCDECPCGECQYTYYVDHSLPESGDGKTWETAFNSINDVFNSGEIDNQRKRLCTIYVKIKGEVNYAISGLFLGINLQEYGEVWLQPSEESGKIKCTLDYNSIPLLREQRQLGQLYRGSNMFLVFDRWDISAKTDYKNYSDSVNGGANNGLFVECNRVRIIDSNIYFFNDLLSNQYLKRTYLVNGSSDFSIYNSDVTIDLVRYDGIKDDDSGAAVFAAFSMVQNAKNVNVKINFDLNGYPSGSTAGNPGEFELAGFYYGWGYGSKLEKINVDFSGRILATQARLKAYEFWYPTAGKTTISDCTSSFSLDFNVMETDTFNYPEAWFCRFHSRYLENIIFSNCEQHCELYYYYNDENFDYREENLCRGYCNPITNTDDLLLSSASMNATEPSPSTACRYAEDTGEKAFPAAPCRGNRIICHKIEGHTSYTKACTPEKCKYYTES